MNTATQGGSTMGTVTIIKIPHKDQRYNTVGDYLTDENGNTTIWVSDLGDWRMEDCIATHERVEIQLCQEAGITDKMIDDFDFAFAKNRGANDASEPGNDPAAPYYEAHQEATRAEKARAAELGLEWDAYEARIAEVMATYPESKDS